MPELKHATQGPMPAIPSSPRFPIQPMTELAGRDLHARPHSVRTTTGTPHLPVSPPLPLPFLDHRARSACAAPWCLRATSRTPRRRRPSSTPTASSTRVGRQLCWVRLALCGRRLCVEQRRPSLTPTASSTRVGDELLEFSIHCFFGCGRVLRRRLLPHGWAGGNLLFTQFMAACGCARRPSSTPTASSTRVRTLPGWVGLSVCVGGGCVLTSCSGVRRRRLLPHGWVRGG